MTINLRIPFGMTDYQAISELEILINREYVSPEQLQANDAQALSSATHRRVVAVDAEGKIVGTSLIHQEPWRAPGEYDLSLAVGLDYGNQGIGSILYADAVAHAQSCGTHMLVTTLRDDHSLIARSFAEHRGFALRQHWVYWELALLDFEEEPFLDVFTRVQAHNIRFFSLADAGNSLEAQQKLYNLNRRTSLDAPGEDSFPTFDEFVHDIIQAAWFRPDSQLLAADGDQWVGLVAVGLDGARAFNAFTGVEHSHRRKGIAMALTLLAIRYARQHHATHLEVSNDSRNVPMFTLQEQLGYRRIPGRYIMQRSFAGAIAKSR